MEHAEKKAAEDSRHTGKTILVVDDVPANLALISRILQPSYVVKVANSGSVALRLAQAAPAPDLILLDILMPDMDGYQVCARLKAQPSTASIPVIFLTAQTAEEEKGLEEGAVDFISKPILPAVLLARLKTHLALKAASDALRNQNEFLESEVARRTQQVRQVQEVTILALGSLAEARDNETGGHILRTKNYVRALALQMRAMGKHLEVLTDDTIDLMFKSAPLHDIGKVGIPDHILLKPGPLTGEEFEVMKTHTTLGRDAIVNAERRSGFDALFLQFAKEIAYSHQEKWNGKGYPQGLAGEQIPLSARLMAVADVYDALITRRVYKSAMSHEEAVKIIVDGRGSHFDPDMVDAFVAVLEQFRDIARRFAD